MIEPKKICCPECQGEGRIQVTSYPDGGAKDINMENCEMCEGVGILVAFPEGKVRFALTVIETDED